MFQNNNHITVAPRWITAAAALIATICCAPAAAELPQLDGVMDRDPVLTVQTAEYALPPEWQSLWKQSLAGPEEDLRRETAEAVARAQRLRSTGLEDFPAALISALAASKNPTVRLTIASALIELNAVSAAADLAALVDKGGDRESLVIEPALARWNYAPFRDAWRQRLAAPQATSRRRLLLAIECVEVSGDTAAEPSLRALALDLRQAVDIRLPAARALGQMHTSDLLDDARRLAARTAPHQLIDRLVAVHVIGSDRSEPAQQLLVQLAVDPQSAVAAIALDRLLVIDPLLVQPLAPALLGRPEGELRQRAARSLAARPTAEHVVTLARLLDDPHLDVRTTARESLQELAARPELHDAVIAEVSAVLRLPGWRGQEQAARLAGELAQQPEAGRLLEMLESDRDEVAITAAWALGRLSVPDTLPAMLAFAERAAGVASDPATAITTGGDQCLLHLFQAFGQLQHAPAEALLLQFVPRRYDVSPATRAAAIWALGHLHAGDPQPELAQQFAQRLADDGEIPVPEPEEVRSQAAVGLGRMNAADAIEVLRSVYNRKDPGSPIRASCRWAIEQITGTALPDPEPRFVPPPAPFLQPLGP